MRREVWLRKSGGLWRALSLVLVTALNGGCAVSQTDYTTPLGQKAIADTVRISLNSGDCESAYQVIEPWYNSTYTNNEARLLMAGVFGCYTGAKVLDLMVNFVTNPAALSGSGFWRLLTQYFPSTTALTDRKLETALFGINAAQSAITPGVVLNPLYTVNGASHNPQSLVVGDRMDDGNAYLMFLGLAGIGAIQNRYGAPNATYVKTVNLPGQTAATVNSVSCQYASAMINFMDGVHGLAQNTTGTFASTLQQIDSNFTLLIASACSLGCTGAAPPAGVVSGCALANCANCPTALRNTAAVCTGVATDQNSCAAAGIINFINNNPFGWN